ncbi:MAG: carboxypeptidase family protein [Gammaproteobacteria bacterium]|nr:carboxypeptidase family protein [Gammaproteobacteria bacterium]
MQISHNFDGGNIRCIDVSDASNIQLEIPKDNNSDFYQWFYFKLSGAKNLDCRLNFVNAANAAYVDGWPDYQAVASYDRQTWFRVATDFDGSVLTINHTPECDVVYYAYFAPYPMERHHDLIANAQLSDLVEHTHLGYTLDGQDMDLLRVGEPGAGKKICWLIARQHPGETMAQWWMEGMINALLDPEDPISRALLDQAVFYVVPNMNPDGSRRGNLRTNAAGANLNREWQNPSMEYSPEVFLVRQKMQQTGLDFCLDVHGDEALPYNFIAGAEGIPSWNEQRQAELDHYQQALVNASPDFQTDIGYEKDLPGQALMTVGTNYIAEHFNCLAMTLEMPFKDTVDTPDEEMGWSPERSRKLGVASLNALYQTLAKL